MKEINLFLRDVLAVRLGTHIPSTDAIPSNDLYTIETLNTFLSNRCTLPASWCEVVNTKRILTICLTEVEKYDAKRTYKHFLGYSPSMVTMGRFIFYLENRDNNTNFYLYNVSLPLMCLFGVETTERVKDFLYHFISESAKWIWTARKNALNIYSGKL